MNKAEIINGVTKRFLGDKITYLFPEAFIVVSSNTETIQTTLFAVPSFVDSTNFSDLTEVFGTTDAESYVDKLIDLGLYGVAYESSTSGGFLQSVTVIRSVDDFPVSLDSSTLYLIDDMADGIDLGARQLESTGDIYIRGESNNTGGLKSSQDNYSMFVGGANIFLDRLRIQVSGAGSKVFDSLDLSGSNAVECTTVNFENCNSLGVLTNYRQGLWQNVAVFNCADGLTLAGNWAGGFAIFTAIVRGFDASNSGNSLLKADALATFGSRVISDANIEVNGSSSAYSFTASNFTEDQQFQLLGGQLQGTGTYVDGIGVDSTRAVFNSKGLPKTSPGGKMAFTASATTAIPSSNTPVKLEGTTALSENIWFDMPQSNRLRWLSEIDAEVQLLGFFALTGGNNDQLALQVRLFNELDVLQNTFTYPSATANGGLLNTRAENVSIGEYFGISKDWYVEIWVENQSDSSDVSVVLDSKVLIKQRTSI